MTFATEDPSRCSCAAYSNDSATETVSGGWQNISTDEDRDESWRRHDYDNDDGSDEIPRLHSFPGCVVAFVDVFISSPPVDSSPFW